MYVKLTSNRRLLKCSLDIKDMFRWWWDNTEFTATLQAKWFKMLQRLCFYMVKQVPDCTIITIKISKYYITMMSCYLTLFAIHTHHDIGNNVSGV